ncbi:YitT family protein [Paenibacillus sp. MER 99-2]|uniref:YitT family protein n=1 Tax=Paenibacillus sp. MER 99-2 TaxID=2939572 RepID=UPI00203A98C9|nr:YitT family protein [Paenibacillus sp. MER 99-2]MCM3174171.1 YitT family protein [Paenibacillus sp. MER 99-2]
MQQQQPSHQHPNRKKRLTTLIPLNGPWRNVVDTASIILGSFLIAVAFNLFLLPNQIASGGVSGLSILGDEWLGLEPAYTQWAINIPLLIAGFLLIGKQYGIRSVLGSIVLPLFVYLTKDWTIPTTNPLLGSLYGGIGVGLGIGIVYRGRGSTGGMSILARIVQKYSGLSYSICVVIMDATVIIMAAFVLSLEQSLYALIGLYVTGKVIDAVEMGLGYSKVAYIISNQIEPITKVILEDLDRGLTKLEAKGGYTDDQRTVLMVVVGQNEVPRLKTLIRSVDPAAFVIISNAHEVLGEGFKREET